MDANKKFDLVNLQCLNERKILANILINHPLRLSVVGSASVPWIYISQFWHTLKEDGSKYQFKFSLGICSYDSIIMIESTQGTHRTPSAPRSPNPVTNERETSAPRKSTVIRFRVPRRQDPKTIIPTAAKVDLTNMEATKQISIATKRSLDDLEAQQNVKQVKEHMMDEELDHFLDGTVNVDVDEFMRDIFNNQEDPDTRIDPGKEEESAGDEFELRRRDYMSNNILHVHPTQNAKANAQDLQYQLYLMMRDDEQLHNADLAIYQIRQAQGTPIDQTKYHSMIRGLMYLTASTPDIVVVTFSYYMGLWYLNDSGFKLIAYLDADHIGCHDDCKSTSKGLQFLVEKLVSWSSKNQDRIALSTAEVEFNKIPMYCDSKSAIALSCNLVQHSRTKHIDIRYLFIKEHVERGMVELYIVRTKYQLADLFTKALLKERFEYLVHRIVMRCMTPAQLESLTNVSGRCSYDSIIMIESTQRTHRTPSAPRSPNPVTTEREMSAPRNSTVENDVDLVIVNANEEEEESAGDEFELRRRVKGKGIEEIRSSSPPTPITSPRTHIAPLSTDKETLQELTVINKDTPLSADKEKLHELTITDSTPSSSSPKPKT
ncbi:hypothetical protein Tco_0894948 [Tanacetum coccineum]|uniref:Reverse transcriptase Ty1/copia-type domain-containing protein n=1 Tax=Tanacetum coccineum TaxID=301880 RepID=A0ABQ5CD48_9ASTR